MDFYVSWYPGDPDYPRHDPDCALLISITSVARDWTIRRLSRLPRCLLIDSGGYRFATAADEAPEPAEVLERQLALLDGAFVPTVLCALDEPILNRDASPAERDHSITQTIAYAYELKNLTERRRLPAHVMPMAIIQGDSVESLRYCAQELMAIGFPLYGLGSLAELRRHNLIMERVHAVAALVGPERLHIFGVSVVKTLRALRRLGIRSFDSSSPAKAAAYNEIFYSRPLRRYGILESDVGPLKGRIPRKRRLSEPLPCGCPVCEKHPEWILGVGRREAIRQRALHNYYHLKRERCND